MRATFSMPLQIETFGRKLKGEKKKLFDITEDRLEKTFSMEINCKS